jgi:hypothetical protein
MGRPGQRQGLELQERKRRLVKKILPALTLFLFSFFFLNFIFGENSSTLSFIVQEQADGGQEAGVAEHGQGIDRPAQETVLEQDHQRDESQREDKGIGEPLDDVKASLAREEAQAKAIARQEQGQEQGDNAGNQGKPIHFKSLERNSKNYLFK